MKFNCIHDPIFCAQASAEIAAAEPTNETTSEFKKKTLFSCKDLTTIYSINHAEKFFRSAVCLFMYLCCTSFLALHSIQPSVISLLSSS